MIITVDNYHKEKYNDYNTNSNEIDTNTWKILIVDDDTAVHNLTRVILDHFSYDNRELEIFNAFSEKEAKSILREEKLARA